MKNTSDTHNETINQLSHMTKPLGLTKQSYVACLTLHIKIETQHTVPFGQLASSKSPVCPLPRSGKETVDCILNRIGQYESYNTTNDLYYQMKTGRGDLFKDNHRLVVLLLRLTMTLISSPNQQCAPLRTGSRVKSEADRMNDILSGSVVAYVSRTELASQYAQQNEEFRPKAEWATLHARTTRRGN